jgi:tetratricopeptide (TPR) repeat protein
MTASCERWCALSDRATLGEALSLEEQGFLTDHVSECRPCAAEARAFAALSTALSEPSALHEPLALGDDSGSGQVRKLLRRAGSGLRARSTRLGVGALCVTLALGLLARRELTPKQELSASARVTFTSGAVEVDGEKARLDEALSVDNRLNVHAGRACLTFDSDIKTCLTGESVARIAELASARTLELRAGRVLASLAPQAAGRSFAIETSAGSVFAKGTLFAVEITATGATEVRLYQGTLLLRTRDGRELILHAREQASLGGALAARPLSDASNPEDTALAALTRLDSTRGATVLTVNATPAGSRVSLDGQALGEAPVSALVTDGRRLTVEHAGFAPVSERLWLDSTPSIARSYELVPLAALPLAANGALHEHASEPSADAQPAPTPRGGEGSGTGPASSAAETSSRARPAELLTRARALRASGRYREAAAVYRQLVSSYPRSDEARVSWVSLGELSLSELGDAEAALSCFESYLRGGGSLSQEARYGKIRALGKLHRVAEERAAIERFLVDYPKSVQSGSLRAKLESL